MTTSAYVGTAPAPRTLAPRRAGQVDMCVDYADVIAALMGEYVHTAVPVTLPGYEGMFFQPPTHEVSVRVIGLPNSARAGLRSFIYTYFNTPDEDGFVLLPVGEVAVANVVDTSMPGYRVEYVSITVRVNRAHLHGTRPMGAGEATVRIRPRSR